MSLNLDRLDEVTCSGCDESTTLEEIRGLVAGWVRVLAWIESAPPPPPEDGL